MEKFVCKIWENIIASKTYLTGLFAILCVFSIILSFYCNSAIQLNDGWLEIYSNSLLNGGFLYKDLNFPLLPFPVFLFTFISKIFGETLIVSHIAGFVLKLVFVSLFYSILFKFFGGRNAFIGTLASGIIFIGLIFDSCLFSYNDLVYVLGLASILVLLKIIEKLEKSTNFNIYSFILGCLLGIMLLSKQTHGIVISVASIVLQAISIIKYKNVKDAIKSTIITFLPIILMMLGLFTYLYKTNTLNDFYVNVIGGVSSKGDAKNLIYHHFKVLANSNLIWVIYFATCVFIAYFCATKNILMSFKQHDNKFDNVYSIILSLIVSLILISLAYFSIKHIGFDVFNFKLFLTIDKVFKQVCAIGFLFTDIMVFYLLFDCIFSKNFSDTKFQYFVLLAMIFSLNYSIMLSNSEVNLTFLSIGFMIAWLLKQETPLYKIKNTFFYISVAILVFLGVTAKLICPAYWHCWAADSVLEPKRQTQSIPFLKGMYLPIQEVDFFEDVRKISDKYTNPTDKIYCLINNQIFYRILDRKPLTENANLYFDLCSDEKALSDMNKILSNPPKLIVLLKFPDYIIDMHEYLFRKSQISGQRHLYNAIFNLVNQKKYVIAKTYKDEFYDFNSNFEKFVANKKDKQYLANLDKKIRKENNNFSKIEKPYYSQIMKHNEKIEKLYAEKLVICEKYRKLMNIDKHRYFLPDGYEMFILIRSDIYKGN